MNSPLYTSSIADCEHTNNHGTLVSEAIMDVAPDAQLYIANAQGLREFKRAVNWMIESGVHIINMSMNWAWEGSGNGVSTSESVILAYAEKAIDIGIVWVNSAGNDNMNRIYYGGFIDSDDNRWVDFTNQEPAQGTLADTNDVLRSHATVGQFPTYMLRWGSGDDDSGVETDLDLYVCTNLQCSGDFKRGSSPGDSGSLLLELFRKKGIGIGDYLRVCHQNGPEPEWLQLGILGDDYKLRYSSGFYTIGNPAESTALGMLSVGAASVAVPTITPTYTLATSSSRGPTASGVVKPELVGAHGEFSRILESA